MPSVGPDASRSGLVPSIEELISDRERSSLISSNLSHQPQPLSDLFPLVGGAHIIHIECLSGQGGGSVPDNGVGYRLCILRINRLGLECGLPGIFITDRPFVCRRQTGLIGEV